jgi:hypothetical protein
VLQADAQTSTSCKNEDKFNSISAVHLVANSTTKSSLSTLSPYVAEFIPQSVALKKKNQNDAKFAECSVESTSQEKTPFNASTVKDLSRKAKEGYEPHRRAWQTDNTQKVWRYPHYTQGRRDWGSSTPSYRIPRRSEEVSIFLMDSCYHNTGLEIQKKICLPFFILLGAPISYGLNLWPAIYVFSPAISKIWPAVWPLAGRYFEPCNIYVYELSVFFINFVPVVLG